MRKSFSATDKIEIIRKVLVEGQTVYSVCRQYGISKVSFYKWLALYNSGRKNRVFALSNSFRVGTSHPKSLSYKQQLVILSLVHKNPTLSCRMIARRLGIGHHGVQTLLERKHLSRYQDRVNFSSRPFWKRETADRRLGMMELLESGWKVKDICAHFGVSKVTFNKWKRIYSLSEEKSATPLADRYISGQAHPRRLPQESEKRVLAVVSSNPQFSVHQIHRHLAGEVGHHGIQNLLAREDLNTMAKRMLFAQGYMHAPKVEIAPLYIPEMPMYRLRQLIAPFLTVPRLVSLFTRGQILLVFILFSFFYVYKLLSYIVSSPQGSPVGTFFASISITFGLFFFIYSMKYYISILMVLRLASSSAKASEDKQSKVSPLNVDLSKVELLGHPFVSIHVALYNEKRVVERLIRACTSQSWLTADSLQQSAVSSKQLANYEVVIADDSIDETTEIAKQVLVEGLGYKEVRTFYDDELETFVFTAVSGEQNAVSILPTVKLIHRFSRTGFKGGALQKALEQTDERAGYVAVFDADFVPYPDTIEQFVKSFQVTCGGLEKVKESNIAAVQGYQWHVLNKSQTWVTRGVRTEYAGSYVIERSGAEIYGGLKQIAGSVYMIRADVLRGFGWGTSITEDFELTLRLYENGFKVVFTPYIQAPAEAVSTIKKLIRQRMRWAEGASYNIKAMLPRILKSKRLTGVEKAEFVYLAPYYLQAAFFVIGTFAWFVSEAVLRSHLPFWTAAFGWSLVFTNMLALPLMNIIGLFLEESDERDYTGIFSFIVLSYIVVPFQAYAAIKGFLESSEGPWFRTPKTGLVTDTFGRTGFGKFFGNVFGRPSPAGSQAASQV
ncbi:MAG: glycosyltransferase family 2 protein, partial [bacterium]|nr:glycosyltransferase family 2 protein [bacterium]